MLSILRTVMQILDFRQSQIEKELGWSVSYLGRLLSGSIELRFEHVVDISRAMGLRPEELLRFAYPQWGEPPSEAGRRVREITASLAPRNLAPEHGG
ncbi:MAG TPA: helix-turn-helix transcriptional regulator [Thermoanaerobaculia bacterium]|nr:helix-turn-helix transcriptional regulator [Thermoanaerobaculia bacterium]